MVAQAAAAVAVAEAAQMGTAVAVLARAATTVAAAAPMVEEVAGKVRGAVVVASVLDKSLGNPHYNSALSRCTRKARSTLCLRLPLRGRRRFHTKKRSHRSDCTMRADRDLVETRRFPPMRTMEDIEAAVVQAGDMGEIESVDQKVASAAWAMVDAEKQ